MKIDVMLFFQKQCDMAGPDVLGHLGISEASFRKAKETTKEREALLETIKTYGSIPDQKISKYDGMLRETPLNDEDDPSEWLDLRRQHIQTLTNTIRASGRRTLLDILLGWRTACESEPRLADRLRMSFIYAMLESGFWTTSLAELCAIAEIHAWREPLMSIIPDEDKIHLKGVGLPWATSRQQAHILQNLYGKYILDRRNTGGWEDTWEPNNTPEGIWHPADGAPKPSA